MNNYTDIHSHLIPGVDDGAADMAESLKMAKMAYKEGVRRIIATPHYGIFNPDYDSDKAKEKFDKMKAEIVSKYSDMEVFMGNELYYSPGVIKDLKDGKAMTMAGTDYILVEFWSGESYNRIYDGLKAAVVEGYRPILAHTERYEHLYKDIESVRRLIDMGVYTQINTRCFLISRFDKRASWCRKLLKNGCIHFVASDSHDTGARKPVFRSAVEKMIGISDEKTVEKIVKTNIEKMMNNKFI